MAFAAVKKWLKNTISSKSGKKEAKTIAQYQQEALVTQAEKQFKKLIDLGLQIPVAHL